MSEAQHTPGPWKGKRIGFATFIYSDGQPNIAAVHNNDSTEGQANAALIVAAPEMLDALEMAEAFISNELETREDGFLPYPSADESEYIAEAKSALNAVRAAIAKSVCAEDSRRAS